MLCVTSNAHKCDPPRAPLPCRRAQKNITASSGQDPDRTTGDFRCQETQKLLRTSTAGRHLPLPPKTELLAAFTRSAVKLPRHDLTGHQVVSQCSARYAATRPHSFLRNQTTHNDQVKGLATLFRESRLNALLAAFDALIIRGLSRCDNTTCISGVFCLKMDS